MKEAHCRFKLNVHCNQECGEHPQTKEIEVSPGYTEAELNYHLAGELMSFIAEVVGAWWEPIK